ncbi:MAG: tRNA lysidine(34) synthetase TilS [Roseburia sp.]|nr:tRNA lysidine(34) synthetase TilS [Roseburia sp.]
MEEKQMINRVMAYVNEQHMFDEDDDVVAGVSGGADSVCLLFMLLEIRRVIPIRIHVVHVNHLLRAQAGDDAAYVERLCRRLELPFTLVERDVAAIAAERRISTEEAGRAVRYEAFNEALGDDRGKIAVAHNKNDCCETFLFHLFRGSALKGLAGIPPVRDRIVRPLLCLERAQIEAFLAQRRIAFCIDHTNLEDNYTRNKIRHHIMETVGKEISPAVTEHIGEACARIGEAWELIADLTAAGYDNCVTCKEQCGETVYYLNAEAFHALHGTIQGYVLMELLSRAAGSARDLTAAHVARLRELLSRQCGRQADLPCGLTAVRDYDGLHIRSASQTACAPAAETVLGEPEISRLLAGECLRIPWREGAALEFLLQKTDKLQNIPQKKYTKWFDYDKIENSIVVRTRKPGDYLTVNAMNQRKTLKAYFIDRKIPREARDGICLVADGSHILWVVGERISGYYKVSPHTETVLQVSFVSENQGGNQDGGTHQGHVDGERSRCQDTGYRGTDKP